jgi:PilZ domain-containing protein
MKESRRRWRRKQSGALCVVRFQGGTPLECRLVNISNSGARLHCFIDPRTLPERIKLFVRDRQVKLYRCSVAWRADREIGVQFLGPPKRIQSSSGTHATLLNEATAIQVTSSV